jgi:hypothetical protein
VKGLEPSFPEFVPSNSWKAEKFKFQRMGVFNKKECGLMFVITNHCL